MAGPCDPLSGRGRRGAVLTHRWKLRMVRVSDRGPPGGPRRRPVRLDQIDPAAADAQAPFLGTPAAGRARAEPGGAARVAQRGGVDPEAQREVADGREPRSARGERSPPRGRSSPRARARGAARRRDPRTRSAGAQHGPDGRRAVPRRPCRLLRARERAADRVRAGHQQRAPLERSGRRRRRRPRAPVAGQVPARGRGPGARRSDRAQASRPRRGRRDGPIPGADAQRALGGRPRAHRAHPRLRRSSRAIARSLEARRGE